MAEFLGSMLLLTIIVGSGIMGERLSQGNTAIALLANSLATGAGLVVLISIFESISGAHFNPLVSLVESLRFKIKRKVALLYGIAQLSGAILGVILAHLMFEKAFISFSEQIRSSPALWLSELIASFGLILVILGVSKSNKTLVPFAVGLYITSAYWFTSSTSFANPAVTIARAFTSTFTGIRIVDTIPFVIAQIFGALLANYLFVWFESNDKEGLRN